MGLGETCSLFDMASIRGSFSTSLTVALNQSLPQSTISQHIMGVFLIWNEALDRVLVTLQRAGGGKLETT